MPEAQDTRPGTSFEADIKPLFREKDRQAMIKAFDLWSAIDVAQRAEAIYSSVAAGRMPCDGAWPEADKALLRRWIDEGCRP